jgi:hypothetical protein
MVTHRPFFCRSLSADFQCSILPSGFAAPFGAGRGNAPVFWGHMVLSKGTAIFQYVDLANPAAYPVPEPATMLVLGFGLARVLRSKKAKN